MKKLLFALTFIFSTSLFAGELKWSCNQLGLRFNEVPGRMGDEFRVEGCYQAKTLFLLSVDCQKNPKECLARGENNKLKHPGGGIGSPAFVQCYNVGGRPRFLQVRVNGKWENTSSCFFGSKNSFMDFDTISKHHK